MASDTPSMTLTPNMPALILAPMQGMTDAPMRAVLAEKGAFTFAVAEFLRISLDVPSPKHFLRHVPELRQPGSGRTERPLPVQVQLLGGHAGRMAAGASAACEAGARAIDINFGCPAPTVNRHDGGATLLKYPKRIREIVAAVREALPPDIPVSAKLRLGWDSIEDIYENAEMAAEGGAAWVTIHGRTRVAGYRPPAYWNPIGQVRERLSIPVVANGDLWSLEDFRCCREETGCIHFMLGRGALANPRLPYQVAAELGLVPPKPETETPFDWAAQIRRLAAFMEVSDVPAPRFVLGRLKQWLYLAETHGDFTAFDLVKRTQTVEELFAILT
ncbi:MAG: tRNA-dihydrouridine synthase family protein [Armatimonadota bacterium]|nr:tRNA-dihydrouridine synthase family protein [Armatimonadota bacterium]